LQDWLSQVVFQAQSAKTPIQILGSLEAEGLYFDAAWVLGMTDGFLPAWQIVLEKQLARANLANPWRHEWHSLEYLFVPVD
jgi:inactivated superfamily I helicase